MSDAAAQTSTPRGDSTRRLAYTELRNHFADLGLIK